VERFVAPPDVATRLVLLGPQALGEADGFGGLGVGDERDPDAVFLVN
jgi:hypothetical protein